MSEARFDPPTVWFGTYGGTTSVYFDLPPAVAWTASLSSSATGWLKLTAGAQGTGPGLVTLVALRSTSEARQAELTVTPARGAPLVWPVAQMTAIPVATLNASALAVPFFPRTPTVMELGIAGKFIAQEIKKIPEPFTLLALALVEVVVILLGVLAITLRGMLASLVPEPETWFGAPEPYDELTRSLPATAVFLTEETTLLAIYIAEQTLAGE